MARKHDQRGRSKGGERYVRLTHFLTGTPAWRSLPPAGRALYLEVARLYNGSNNGSIALSVRDADDRCNINKDTAARAFRLLEERGFIECVTPGGFSRKSRHAAEWRLTDCPCNRTGKLATKDYQRWREPEVIVPPKCKTRSPKTGQAVPSFRTVTPFRARTVP